MVIAMVTRRRIFASPRMPGRSNPSPPANRLLTDSTALVVVVLPLVAGPRHWRELRGRRLSGAPAQVRTCSLTHSAPTPRLLESARADQGQRDGGAVHGRVGGADADGARTAPL